MILLLRDLIYEEGSLLAIPGVADSSEGEGSGKNAPFVVIIEDQEDP